MSYKNELGKQGELFACDFLKNNKYKIICCNYFTRYGEVDIIARKKDVLFFVEVKTRKSLKYGSAAEAVTYSKRKKIMLAALVYLEKEKPQYDTYSFDVIEVYLTDNDKIDSINHIKEAFSYN